MTDLNELTRRRNNLNSEIHSKGDLNDLVRLRNELDAEINRLQTAEMDEYNDRINHLIGEVEQWSNDKGFKVREHDYRKNWTFRTYDHLRIGFGLDESPEYERPYDPVVVADNSDGGCRVTFSDVPSSRVLLALLEGMR